MFDQHWETNLLLRCKRLNCFSTQIRRKGKSLYELGEVATWVIVDITSHAELRMKDRGITEAQIHKVLRNPKEVISVRYGRLAAYGEIEERKLVV